MTFLALDLGGTKLAAAAFSADGDIIHRANVPVAGRQGSDVARLVARQCELLREHLAARGECEPSAVGVCVPGIYRADRGTVWAPNLSGWDDYPLRDELQRALGVEIRVVIDSDRAAYILGETWRGAASGVRDAIFLAVGTGIGAGILVDGRVLRGSGDVAGAIGWLALDRPFRDAYASCGCFEHHASGPGLAKVARALLESEPGYTGPLRALPPDDITAEQLFAVLDRGDPIAARVIDDAVSFWGMAVANLVSLFNPEIVVFGGGVFGPATRLLDRIREEAARWAQPIAMPRTRVVASSLGADAGLYGAGRLAMLAMPSARQAAIPAMAPHSSPSIA